MSLSTASNRPLRLSEYVIAFRVMRYFYIRPPRPLCLTITLLHVFSGHCRVRSFVRSFLWMRCCGVNLLLRRRNRRRRRRRVALARTRARVLTEAIFQCRTTSFLPSFLHHHRRGIRESKLQNVLRRHHANQ